MNQQMNHSFLLVFPEKALSLQKKLKIMNIKELFSVVSLFATSFIPTLAQEVYTDNQGVEYTQTGATTCVVSGASKSLQANITIPSTINGWTVTGINEYAFDGILNVPDVLKTVVIADGITNIGECAFSSQTSLSTVTLPEGLVIIPTGLFSDCISLSTFNIPSTVTVIRPAAFQGIGSNLKSVTIPVSVQTICSQAFCTDPNTVDQVTFYCESTTPPNVHVRTQDNKLTTYWYEGSSFCFSNNNKYGRLVVPKGAKTAYEASNWKNSFTEIVEEAIVSSEKIDGIYYNLKKYSRTAEVKSNPNKYTGEVVIPSSVTYNNETYRVTGIDDQAFYQCTELTGLTIPASITYIGKTSSPGSANVFRNCIENVFKKVYISDLAAWCRITFADDFYANPLSVAHHLYLNSSEITELVIPNTITSLGTFQFASCHGITSVTIPESVTNLGLAIFYDCRNLASVNIPSSITSIGVNMFNGCDRLSSVTIPNSITTIEHGAFIYTGLTTVRIPSSVTTIGYSAFSELSSLVIEKNTPLAIADNTFTNRKNTDLIVPVGCVAAYQAADYWKDFKTISANTPAQEFTDEQGVKYTLTSNGNAYTVSGHTDACAGDVIIPATLNGCSVTSISDNAFNSCYGMTSIVIPNSVTNIGIRAFEWCDGMKSVSIPNTVTTIGEQTFRHCEALTSVDIPNSVTSIGNSAFSDCTKLESVTIPNSVTSIGVSTFSDCSSLLSITIPNSVTSIGSTAFGKCRVISTIEVEDGNLVYDSRNNCNAIIETSSNTLIVGCKNTLIPNTVTIIGDYSFWGCNGLTSMRIPSSVTTISTSAFQGCSGLMSVTIPSSTTSIGKSSFEGCQNLVEVISNIKIPSSVSLGKKAFNGIASDAVLKVPLGSKDLYLAADGWNGFTSIVEFEENITDAQGVIYTLNNDGNSYTVTGHTDACTGEIVIPATVNELSVTSIGEFAFHLCTELTSVSIPNSVTSIGRNAFGVCWNLTSVSIPNSVTSIGVGAFDNCPGLESVIVEAGNPNYDSRDNCNAIIETSSNTLIAGCKNTEIPNTVTSIGRMAFFGCYSLKSIALPNSVTFIDTWAFGGTGLTSVGIPASVVTIGDNPFRDCVDLGLVWVNENNPKFDSRDNCNAIIEKETNTLKSGCKVSFIPSSVEIIGTDAFRTIRSLKSIIIPGGVTAIGATSFLGCDNLTSVTMVATAPISGGSEFSNRTNATLYVQTGSKEAYEAADYWKEFKNIVEIGTGNITFADSNVKQICVNNWDTNGDGELNFFEAHSVANIGTAFKNNSQITSFDELQYFTGLTSIGDNTFMYCTKLQSVVLPNSLESLGGAFCYCSSLKSIFIPSLVTSIEFVWAFEGCTSLTSMSVDKDNTVYDSRNNCNAIIETANNKLHRGCDTTVIPDGVEEIRSNAFINAMNMTSITFPQSVSTMQSNIFNRNNVVTSVIVLNSTPPTITEATFDHVSNKATLYVPSGSKEAYQTANYWSAFNNIEELAEEEVTDAQGVIYTLNTDCQTYTASGFNKESPGAIIIPATVNGLSVTSIGGGFRSSGLTSVYIPASVTSVVFPALRWCPELESIQVENGNTVFDSRNNCNAIIETASNTLINGCKNTVIPNDVTTIGEWAFGYSGITSVTIPANVTQIQSNAFSGCGSVESIQVESGNNVYDSRDNCNAIIETASNVLIRGCHNTVIPNSVTSIYVAAFRGCGSLTSINIPENVTSIGSDAFWECGNLTTVTLSKNVTSIGSLAFADCALTDVYCLAANVPTTEATTFQDTPIGSATLHVPAGSVEAYQAAAPWSGFNKVVALSTNIPDVEIQGVYYNLNEETLTAEVTMNPNKYSGEVSIASGIWYDSRLYSVTSIGVDAFQFCNLLTSVVIPNSVTSIGSYAFYFCEDLSSIMIPNSVTKIFGNPFQGCSSLESILVEEGNTTYDSRNNCNAIIETGSNTLISGCKNTVIPANVTTIGDNAFTEIANLTSITIPASVEYIGSASFSSCSNLESIQVESGNTKYDSRNNCNAIIESSSNTLIHGCKNTVIPANVTSIGEMAFDECDGLTSVTIPSAVTFIGISAFEECKDLVSMQVESGNTVYDSRNNCNAIIETASNTLISGCKNTIIPISVTSIGENAFRYCFGLTFLTIPCNVTSIGNMAFFNCYQLTDIYCSAENVPTTGYGAFDAINGDNVTLYVPAGSVEAYKTESPWKDFGMIRSIVTSLFDGTNLWTSYVAQEDYAIPAGLEAYVISSLSETSAVASQIDYIPQGVPLLLKRNDATTNSFDFATGSGTAPTTNLLKVYDTDKTVSNREGYILYKDEFVLVDEGTLPAGRVFLPLNGGNAAMTRGIVVEGEGTTGIQNLVSDSEVSHGVWYDLQGRKIDGKPIKKGVYILNGRKVVVK